ncbi:MULTISPECIES: hypothetical protein [unclassified Bradyrhizobium]|uniref:hypothetical protein n=1 Tax=unclassified Bradyrhizobium TaxID=2631580 RepID=UPI0015C84D56|nr:MULTISPECIES: hypothetical protein [unclassified Bradyrhizobium]MBB4264291.1 hypothetical protein [Bradyrhizobium sp. CIR3A]NYG50042.1 hypothetical protein [Bradyrhizobium sp. IAR9]
MPNEKWTIAQAIQEAVSGDLYEQVHAARIARGRKAPFVISVGLHGFPDLRHREFQIKDREWKQLKFQAEDGLRKTLLAGELSSTGRFGSVAAEERFIPPSGWQHIKIIDWQKSTGREIPTGTTVFDIRLSIARRAKSERVDKAVQKATTSQGRERAFVRLLIRIIKDSPEKPCLTRKQLENEAVAEKWLLGPRAINRCWSKAVTDAKAPAWRAEGRRSPKALAALPEWAREELGLPS